MKALLSRIQRQGMPPAQLHLPPALARLPSTATPANDVAPLRPAPLPRCAIQRRSPIGMEEPPNPCAGIRAASPRPAPADADCSPARHRAPKPARCPAWLGQAREPDQSQLAKLIGAAFRRSWRASWSTCPSSETHKHRPSTGCWNVLSRNLRSDAQTQPLYEQGGVFAVVGPTGVGKTTTTAKLAAHFALKHGAGSVGLITVDTYRIGA